MKQVLSFTYIKYYSYCNNKVCHHLLATGEMLTTPNTDSTPSPVKKIPATVTPNTKPHGEDTTKSLTARIKMLEKRVLELEGVLEVTRNTNSLLEQEVDNLQQHQRRACIIVDLHYPGKR